GCSLPGGAPGPRRPRPAGSSRAAGASRGARRAPAARAGSTRSPLWRHGGTIFGPQPRDYSYEIPKKAWRRALCLALSARAREGKLFLVQSLALAEAKTRLAKAALEKLGVAHALVVISE